MGSVYLENVILMLCMAIVSPFWLYGTKGEEMVLTCIFEEDIKRS